MRILSVTIRNYRVHRTLTVAFDPNRTLIGGPNESGKSTLVEAVHRALFLRAKGNTEFHRAMVSTLHGGHPEVELHFEAGGLAYHLKKRFGPSGTVTLIPAGAVALSADSAEAGLARILSVDADVNARAACAQWSHLWVWQGRSGGEPTAHAAAQHANLLQRLQQSGGAAAMQSELDARVAAVFAAANDALFIQSGKPRAGSELEQAALDLTAAEQARREAADRLARSLQAVRDFEESTRTLQRVAEELRVLAGQKAALEAKLIRAEELRRQETEQAHAAQAAAGRHAALESADTQIARLRATLRAREAALAPKNEETRRLTAAGEEAKQRAAHAAREFETACDRTRTARLRRDLVAAWIARFEKGARLAELLRRAAQLGALENDLAALREQLAKLPDLDAAKLRKLQKLEHDAATAEARLHAFATGIEVLSADTPVTVGGALLAPGEVRIFTEEAEVAAGALRLRIRPGGGTSLAEARREAQYARQAYQKTLDAYGLSSTTEAADAVARRNDLAAKIAAAEPVLRDLGAARLPTLLAEAREAAVGAEAEVSRRAEHAGELAAPAAPAEAQQLFGEAEQRLGEAESDETRHKAARDAGVKALAAADEALVRHRQALEEESRELADLAAQLRLLVANHGDDEARGRALAGAHTANTTAAALVSATRRALAELQPELLDADRTRLQRALDLALGAKSEAETRRAVAQSELRTDGSGDPAADVELATARARDAQEHLARVSRKAGAIRLLHRLFLEEQQALAERFTRPLAERISGYLQCLFGSGTSAAVALADHAFTGLQLVRAPSAGGAIPFESLSGGTKEQVAAAVRLAMAEVLATDHGGCLPIVFDDAFAYSDPERVQVLQRMLDLAASRGLQVIVLTCTPSDYSALGAAQITLRIERTPSFAAVVLDPDDAAPNGETGAVVETHPGAGPSATTDTRHERQGRQPRAAQIARLE